MSFRNVQEYYRQVCSLVARKNLQGELHKISYIPNSRDRGTVRGDYVTFSDGGTLRFSEKVSISTDREVVRENYSYHFERDGSYFRYDKDTLRAEPYVHAECHLHVNGEEPRFITHETGFEEVLEFIWACFYND